METNLLCLMEHIEKTLQLFPEGAALQFFLEFEEMDKAGREEGTEEEGRRQAPLAVARLPALG